MTLFIALLASLLALMAQASPSGRPFPAAPAGASPGTMPLAPVNPSPSASAAPSAAPVNPLISLIRSGFKSPAFTPNPVVSMIQSGIKNPAFTQPPTTTYTTEPTSFDLSNISFGTKLLPSPTLSSRPSPFPFPPNTDADNDPNVHATPGTLLACTSTTYNSWAGDLPDAVCDVIPSEFKKCRNFSEALRGKVVAVRPDKGQLCLLFDRDDCYGSAEWIKWPGVRNLRVRVGEGGGWADRARGFMCTTE